MPHRITMAMKKEHKAVKRHSGKGVHPEHSEPSLKTAWQLVKSNRTALLYILFIDAAFGIGLFYFKRFVELLAPSLTPEALVANASLAFYGLALVFVYYLLVLLLYSFAKFLVMSLVRGMRSSESIGFERFLPFYGLNVLLIGIFFFIMLSISYIFAALKNPFQVVGILVLIVPFVLLIFIVMNMAHSRFFAKNTGVLKSVSSSFSFAFTSMRQYGFVIGWNAVFALVFVIVLLIPGFVIQSFSDNFALYASLYEAFTGFTMVFTTFMLYVAAIFSRVAFYLIAEAKDDSSS
jgi:hypothetical protein